MWEMSWPRCQQKAGASVGGLNVLQGRRAYGMRTREMRHDGHSTHVRLTMCIPMAMPDENSVRDMHLPPRVRGS